MGMPQHVATYARQGRKFEIYKCSADELIRKVMEKIPTSRLPDFNLDHLRGCLKRGWRIKEIQLEPYGGPVRGFPGVRFLLERASDGLKVVTPVSPGERLIEFLRQHADEWEQAGIPIKYVE